MRDTYRDKQRDRDGEKPRDEERKNEKIERDPEVYVIIMLLMFVYAYYWWGIVEAHAPQRYNWNGYKKLLQIVRDLKLKIQVCRA